jgi:hypothetical protein
MIQIIDSGNGMSDNIKDSLFQKYTTFDDL